MPLWVICIVFLIAGYLFTAKNFDVFMIGFCIMAIIWGAHAFYSVKISNVVFFEKLGIVFGGLGPYVLCLISLLLGGLIGGLFMISGKHLKHLFSQGS